MPEQLLGRIIRACSREGEVVLDPFSGSATTLVVARKLGRQCLGFELSPEYVTRGQARLDAARQGDPLVGAAEPLVSAPATPTDPKQKKGKLVTRETLAEEEAAAKTQDLMSRGVLEAFRKVSDGHSLDRLLCDPALSAALADECRNLGIAGDVRSWNKRLFRLRKAGKLADVPTFRREEMSWSDCDPFVFASEIAWSRLSDEHDCTLDDILSDPLLAERFDHLAAELAPGFSPLQYRWSALKLRKEAKSARTRAESFASVKLGKALRLEELIDAALPTEAGVYLVTEGKKKPLYAGEAISLRGRLLRQFDAAALPRWMGWSADLRVSLFPARATPSELIAYQSKLVGKHRPKLNHPELAAV
jgi:site-specific DNA-methyltransferase (adenine-specific)